MAPSLAVSNGQLVLSWLDRLGSPMDDPHHRLLASRLTMQGWSKPAVIAEGNDFFANWADIPAVAVAQNGTLLAHWLAKTGDDTYAYSIFLARSEDGGDSWTSFGPLNDDATATEHGFVTYVPDDQGIRAFWLDGREMIDGGAMTLRTALVGDSVGPTEVLDERVCECCSTDSAATAQGPVVVFRDRSDQEIRDIGIVRRAGESWTAAERVHNDDWMITGCPVNGPAVAAREETVAVVWYTAAGDHPKVHLAFSEDAGGSFGTAHVVDDGRPLGRVDIALGEQGDAFVSWLEGADREAEIRIRRVTRDGERGKGLLVARTSPARASGFPRLARLGDLLYVVWVETDEESSSRVRLSEIPLSSLG